MVVVVVVGLRGVVGDILKAQCRPRMQASNTNAGSNWPWYVPWRSTAAYAQPAQKQPHACCCCCCCRGHDPMKDEGAEPDYM